MTRKHFNILARNLRYSRELFDTPRDFHIAVAIVIDFCKGQNPRFDPDRFLAAIGTD